MKRLLLLLAACGAPDTFEVGYGHSWHQAGEARNEFQQVGLDAGDTDMAWAALGWSLGPKPVRIVEQPRPWPEPVWPPNPPERDPDPEPVALNPDDHEAHSSVVETLEAIDGMDWLTRVLITVCVGIIAVLAWAYRRTISGWLGKNHSPPPAA